MPPVFGAKAPLSTDGNGAAARWARSPKQASFPPGRPCTGPHAKRLRVAEFRNLDSCGLPDHSSRPGRRRTMEFLAEARFLRREWEDIGLGSQTPRGLHSSRRTAMRTLTRLPRILAVGGLIVLTVVGCGQLPNAPQSADLSAGSTQSVQSAQPAGLIGSIV